MTSILNKFPNQKTPRKVLKTKGVYYYLDKNEKILDFTSGWTGYANLGFCHPRLVKAVKEQLKKFSHIDFNIWHNPNAEILAKKMTSYTKKNLDKVYFCGSSGSEAVEAAMKLSYQVHFDQGKKKKINFITRFQSFNGSTLQAISVSDLPVLDLYGKLLPKNVYKISQHNPFAKCNFDLKINKCKCGKHYSNCMGKMTSENKTSYTKRCVEEFENAIKKLGSENICAFIGETQLGSLIGDVPAEKNYWSMISKICKKNDIHLILDEVYNGFGRSGKIYNFMWDKLSPDFVCIGKNTTSGLAPLSVVLTKSKFEEIIKKGSGRIRSGHTFQGFALGIVACLESLKIFEENNLLNKININSKYIVKTISEELKNLETFSNIRGRGYGISVEHSTKNNIEFSKNIYQKMFNKYKILVNTKYHRTSFTPAFIISKSKIDYVLDKFIKTFKEASSKKY